MVRCIKVPKSEGNPVRVRLKDEGLLNLDARIRVDGDFLLIPILSDSYGDFEVSDADLETIEHPETDYRNLLPEEVRVSAIFCVESWLPMLSNTKRVTLSSIMVSEIFLRAAISLTTIVW